MIHIYFGNQDFLIIHFSSFCHSVVDFIGWSIASQAYHYLSRFLKDTQQKFELHQEQLLILLNLFSFKSINKDQQHLHLLAELQEPVLFQFTLGVFFTLKNSYSSFILFVFSCVSFLLLTNELTLFDTLHLSDWVSELETNASQMLPRLLDWESQLQNSLQIRGSDDPVNYC